MSTLLPSGLTLYGSHPTAWRHEHEPWRWHRTAVLPKLYLTALRIRQALCRYAYGPTSLVLYCPATSITCHADVPVTQTRLGRACSLDTRTRRLHCTATPTYQQDLAPLRLRYEPDNPSCRYAYDPVAGTVLPPHEPISLVPIRLRAEHN
jgi:hypothetical protein